MAQQILNENSTTPDDGLGDTPPVYTEKINANFTENYSTITALSESVGTIASDLADITVLSDELAGISPLAPAGSSFISDGAGGGEFIRVIGWQQISDSRNTVGSPSQSLVNGVRAHLLNNGVGADIQKLPSDAVSPLWNTTTNKMKAISLFDSYMLRLDFRAQNYSGTAPYIILEIDIGGTVNTFASETKVLIRGGAEQRILWSLPLFSGADFLANDATIYLTYTGGSDCDIFACNLFIERVSKGF